MIVREAGMADIRPIQIIRNAVEENRLSNPSLVTDEDCRHYLTERGKGWVCTINNRVVGFAIADIINHSIWALFVHPEFARQGIGRRLHDSMLNWYFNETKETVWLSTAPGTRAADFYKKAGWEETGTHGKGELKFEMTYSGWVRRQSS
ncbi:MAG: GNAT family N-acetyltransferase [Sphingobacteriales bacterium]|nr:GNAT family N-acetyltransferase [Sphingobacteriales bacterium]OJY84596.1 MAG: GNAT family N-acetyltransferase [Sphingobacteriales bacterium 44-15]